MMVHIRNLGLQDYATVWTAMYNFTAQRNSETPDEFWVVEHPPVFTLGLNGDAAHILNAGSIPVIQTDRGGQVTYHGPGQLVIYTLLDLTRLQLGIRALVSRLEASIQDLLLQYGLHSETRADAPGVYLREQKIAALGLRVKKGCCYHGLSLNVAMDLTPFDRINPCGYAGLEVTQLQDHDVQTLPIEIAAGLLAPLRHRLEYATFTPAPGNHTLLPELA